MPHGVITVTNPNDWEAIDANVFDSLPGCTFDTTMPVTVPKSGSVTVGYTCPSDGTNGTNTATATWDSTAYSTPTGSATGSADFTFGAPTNVVNKTITVTDSYGGPLGTVTGTDPPAAPASATFTYSRTINVVPNCVDYPNTATINETRQSSSAKVTVCGPAKTGALTMGYWQNKNGQAIITGANQTNLRNFLRGYHPFSDAPSTGLAAYVTNIIKSASASGAAMNAMLRGQMLATALDVYFSDPALGGNKINAPAPIGGVVIDLTNINKPIGSSTYENTSSSFAGAACLSVSAMLAYQNTSDPLVDAGAAWYAQVKNGPNSQELAKDSFDAVNNTVAFSC